MAANGFAIIDVETTGLFPGSSDRIVEIAIVHVDRNGEITGDVETLINPGRDLGPQSIHGIRSIDILDAPTFADILDELVTLLADRVLVAHNAAFDARFLTAEFERAGVGLRPEPDFVCTMQLARRLLPGRGRSLAACCDVFEIANDAPHQAIGDARATAHLLRSFLEVDQDTRFWDTQFERAEHRAWPVVDTRHVGTGWKARPLAPTTPSVSAFLQGLTQRMPDLTGPDEHADYLAMLDRALLDREFSAHEVRGLADLATRLGISRETATQLHIEYFDLLVDAAWEDGIVTDDESRDLLRVAAALELDHERMLGALHPRVPRQRSVDSAIEAFGLAVGDVVVLTGEMSRPRAEIEAQLAERGIVSAGNVSRKVRLVVAADPDSLSGKARTARSLGIPVVSEPGLDDILARGR